MSYALVEVSWYDSETLDGLECHGVFDSEDGCWTKKEELEARSKIRKKEILDNAEKFMDQWKIDYPEKYEKFFEGLSCFDKSRLAEHLAYTFSINDDLTLNRQRWGVTVDQFKNPYSFYEFTRSVDYYVLDVPESNNEKDEVSSEATGINNYILITTSSDNIDEYFFIEGEDDYDALEKFLSDHPHSAFSKIIITPLGQCYKFIPGIDFPTGETK